MKVRNGFVSNSSSSSFILTAMPKCDPDLYIELNEYQSQAILNSLRLELEEGQKIYLTKFVNDSSVFNIPELNKYHYCDGDLGCESPYDPRYFILLNEDKRIWIEKIHCDPKTKSEYDLKNMIMNLEKYIKVKGQELYYDIIKELKQRQVI